MNGWRPVSISNSTMPAAYTSARASATPAVTISGDRYATVPSTVPVVAAVASVSGAGKTEVGDLHAAVGVDQDVLGLDVAVDQAGAVRRGEGIKDRLDVIERLTGGQRPPSSCRSRRVGLMR